MIRLYRYIIVAALLGTAVWGCGGTRGTGSGDRVYLHEVKAGESLESIADDYYGDPEQERDIRSFNSIREDEPLLPGTVLRVPLSEKDLTRLKGRGKARAPYNEGLRLAEKGSYVDAVTHFQEALEIDPDFSDASYNLGVAYQKLGAHEKALEPLRRVARKRPKDTRYAFALGNSYFHLESYREAARAFESVLEHDPNHSKALYSLAVCYEKLGEAELAKGAWRRYLELDAKSVWATEARRRLKSLD